jgi:hypothetical protein
VETSAGLTASHNENPVLNRQHSSVFTLVRPDIISVNWVGKVTFPLLLGMFNYILVSLVHVNKNNVIYDRVVFNKCSSSKKLQNSLGAHPNEMLCTGCCV